MTGYETIVIAIKPTNTGNYAITAIMGPDSISYANLSPVNAGTNLMICSLASADRSIDNAFDDSAEALTADVWNIFIIQGRCAHQKLLQFKIVNNSGGSSDIETAFMRIV